MNVATFLEWFMAIVFALIMTIGQIGALVCLFKAFKED